MTPSEAIYVRLDIGQVRGYPGTIQFLADGGIEIWGAKDLGPRLTLRLGAEAKAALVAALMEDGALSSRQRSAG